MTPTNRKRSKNNFWEIFKDKNGYFNLREIATALFMVVVFTGWIAQQFFSLEFPEYMFYGFISLIASGGFGYSIERKQRFPDEMQKDYDKNETNI